MAGSENLFERCTIGVDTVTTGTGMAGLVFAATGGAARNVFRDCLFTLYAGHAGTIFVELPRQCGDRSVYHLRALPVHQSERDCDDRARLRWRPASTPTTSGCCCTIAS